MADLSNYDKVKQGFVDYLDEISQAIETERVIWNRATDQLFESALRQGYIILEVIKKMDELSETDNHMRADVCNNIQVYFLEKYQMPRTNYFRYRLMATYPELARTGIYEKKVGYVGIYKYIIENKPKVKSRGGEKSESTKTKAKKIKKVPLVRVNRHNRSKKRLSDVNSLFDEILSDNVLEPSDIHEVLKHAHRKVSAHCKAKRGADACNPKHSTYIIPVLGTSEDEEIVDYDEDIDFESVFEDELDIDNPLTESDNVVTLPLRN